MKKKERKKEKKKKMIRPDTMEGFEEVGNRTYV